MGRPRRDTTGLALFTLLMLGVVAPRVAPAQTAGTWATYEWRDAARVEYPVLVQQPGATGSAPSWSLDRESAPPPPIFVTYSIVRADAKSYVLQIVTRPTADGQPLSITQVTVDRASGKALKSVIKDKKGVIPTPESGLRPFREGGVQGAREEVAVPAGRFSAVKAAHRNGTVWVTDRVPALGIAKGVFPEGQLELVKSGTTGAQDLLRS